MLREIKVRHTTNHNGTGKLIARCDRLQSTVDYPHELSGVFKPWAAARILADKLERVRDYQLRLVRVKYSDNGPNRETVATFIFEVFDHTVRAFDNTARLKSGTVPIL